jgi:hypothetical protein
VSFLGLPSSAIGVDACVGDIKVVRQDASGADFHDAVDLNVSLSSSNSGQFYSDPGCSSAISSSLILAGWSGSQYTFYFKGSVAGTDQVLARASGYLDGVGAIQLSSVAPTPTPTVTSTPVAPAPGSAELPRVSLNTAYVAPVGGAIRMVSAGGDIQAAIDAANPGDQIVLQAGVTYNVGTLTLPYKACSKPNPNDCTIVIRTSNLSSLPPEGVRVQPSDAVNMPKIVGAYADPVFATNAMAQYYRLIGLEVTVNNLNYVLSGNMQLSNRLIQLGDGSSAQNSLAQVPHDLILDRMYLHGHPLLHCKRAVELHSARSAIVDSYLSEIHGLGQDTQAILGGNGPGPYKIRNNRLEGAGENLMFGGMDPSIPNLIPSDIEIVGNYIMKPMSWYPGDPSFVPVQGIPGQHWLVKNLLELKNAQRVLIEGNILENTWSDGQSVAVSFKSVNQDGSCPWCVTRDITMRNNLVNHMPRPLNVLGGESYIPNDVGTTARISVLNNLFTRVNATDVISPTEYEQIWGSGGITYDVVMSNNSFLDENPMNGMAVMYQLARFQYVNNVDYAGAYGISSGGTSPYGFKAALDTMAPGSYTFTGNVIVGGWDLPAGNSAVSSLPSVLPAGVGADVNLINQVTARVRLGN